MYKFTVPSAALLTRIAIITMGFALFFEQVGARELLHLDSVAGRLIITPAYWVSLVAPAFYLWALWASSCVFVRLDRGDVFGPAMVKGLSAMGGGLMLGAWAAIIFQPVMTYLLGNGFLELSGVRFNLSVENLTLALVGIVLVLLARRGQLLKAKLESFI